MDLDSIRAAYREAYSHLDERANKQADDELEKQVQAARAEHKQLVGVEEARPRFRASARVGLLYSLQREYSDKVSGLMRACAAKSQPVIKLMEQQILSGS